MVSWSRWDFCFSARWPGVPNASCWRSYLGSSMPNSNMSAAVCMCITGYILPFSGTEVWLFRISRWFS